MGLISAASLTPAFTKAQAAYNVSRRITGSTVQTVWLVDIVLRWSGMWVLFPGDGAERERAVLSVWNSISLPNSRLSPLEANSHPGRRVTWVEEYCSCTGYLARQEMRHKAGMFWLCVMFISILCGSFLPLYIFLRFTSVVRETQACPGELLPLSKGETLQCCISQSTWFHTGEYTILIKTYFQTPFVFRLLCKIFIAKSFILYCL